MAAHLYKRKASPSYYIKDGNRLVSLKTNRKGYADQLLQDYIRKRLGIYRTPVKKISAFKEAYLEEARQVNKASTVEDKVRTLEFFINQANDPLVGQVSPKTIQGYLTWRKGNGVSSERWNTERQVLSNFFRYLMKEHVIAENPCLEVPKQKIVRSKIPKSLDRDAEKKLMRWLMKHDEGLYRMSIVVGNTGIRVRELANLTWPDLDFQNKMLAVTAKPDWSPKDYEERSIPLNPIALAVLRKQRVSNRITRYVFPRLDGQKYGRGLDLRMCRAFKGEKAGLGAGGFHALRHTFATRAIESGMDLETLRKIMGHADTKTLMKYTHVSEEHVRRSANKVKFGVTKA